MELCFNHCMNQTLARVQVRFTALVTQIVCDRMVMGLTNVYDESIHVIW